MSLEVTINADIKTAMLAKNEAALRGLRAVKSAILLAKTADGKTGDLTEEDEMKILQKLVKQRKDSLEVFVAQNREDLAAKEREELAIIERFLPQQMSMDELQSALKTIIASVGATSPADMGKVMKSLLPKIAGRAAGDQVSALVRELLQK